jgi:hypothetical protein
MSKAINWDTYVDQTDNPVPPVPGTYTFQRTDGDGDATEGEFTTGAGITAKYVSFKAEFLGGKYAGRSIFGMASTFMLGRGEDKQGCSAQDYLRSAKSNARPTTEDGLITAVLNTFTPFTASTRYEWRIPGGDTFLQGNHKTAKPPKKYGKLPAGYKLNKDKDGNILPLQPNPDGGELIMAQLRLHNFVVPSTTPTVISQTPPLVKSTAKAG